jgi:uncharacterized protein GlcG (DUF336 family)
MLCAALVLGAPAGGEAPPEAPAYGTPITLDVANKVAAAAHEEAKKNGFRDAIAIVEPSGALVYLEKMDDTQYAGPDVAIDKARSTVLYRRSTKVFNEGLGKGAPTIYLMTLRGMQGAEGGVPIMSGGKIIGAIGVSGGTGPQDGQVATAGANAVK